MSAVQKFIAAGISILFQTAIAYLFFIALFSTCFISADEGEFTYYTGDNPLLNLIFLAGIFLLVIWWNTSSMQKEISAKLDNDETLYNRLRSFLLLVIFSVCALWVLHTAYIPRADQYQIQKAAHMLQQGNWFPFLQDGYLARYPHNIGLTLMTCLASFLIGNYNYAALQLLNALYILWFCHTMERVCGLMGMSRLNRLVLMGAYILFFPFLMYASFIYGTIPGLSLALYAFYQELLFFRKGEVKHALYSAFFLLLSMVFKANCMIFGIAMLIHCGFAFLESARARGSLPALPFRKLLLLALLMIFSFILQARLPVFIARQITGAPLDAPSSSYSFIAMGLRDDSMHAVGWYDGFERSSYNESNGNTEMQAAIAKASIKESISRFLEDPQYAFTFFHRKTASQWNNPTFQGFWIVQTMRSRITPAPFLWHFTGVHGADSAAVFLNILQQAILMGCLLSVLFQGSSSEHSLHHLFFAVTFLGGFIFHLFWEAKCQYALPYFVLLLPYAVMGYSGFGIRCAAALSRSTTQDAASRSDAPEASVLSPLPLLFSGIVCLAVLVLLFSTNALGAQGSLCSDDQAYQDYLKEFYYELPIPEGEYILTTMDRKTSLPCYISYYEGSVRIRELSSDLYYDVNETDGYYDLEFHSISDDENNTSQRWRLEPTEDGSFYIHSLNAKDQALTWVPAEALIDVREFCWAEGQHWFLEKKPADVD